MFKGLFKDIEEEGFWGQKNQNIQQLKLKMNSSLINLLLWNLHLKKILIDEICLEKNLDFIRNFINDGEIVDEN